MSLAGLLDSRIRVYRATGAADSFGDQDGAPLSTGGVCAASLQTPRLRQDERGPGEQQTGLINAYVVDNKVDIRPNDVLECTSGPFVGSWWVVTVVFVTHKSRHRELTLRPYNGPRQ